MATPGGAGSHLASLAARRQSLQKARERLSLADTGGVAAARPQTGGLKGSSSTESGVEHVTPGTSSVETHQPAGVWEDTIDSSKVATGSDSVWRSTKEIFLNKSPDQLKDVGFTTPRHLADGSNNPEFGTKLDAWAEKQTNALIEEWSKTHGGKSPDIIHDGDKVTIEFDKSGPHLKIYETKYNGFEEMTETPNSHSPAPSHIEQPSSGGKQESIINRNIDKQILGEPRPHIIHPVTGEDLGEDPGVLPRQDWPAPSAPKAPLEQLHTPTIPSTPSLKHPDVLPPVEIKVPATPFETMKNTFEAITGDNAPARKVETIRNYISDMTSKPDYHGTNISGEKLNTLAQLLVSENRKLDSLVDMDTLTKAVETFEVQINKATSALLTHHFDNDKGYVIPIISADEKHVYFAQNLDHGWSLRKYNQDGSISALMQNIKKRMYDKDAAMFDLEDIADVLGYKMK